ncbi:MAG: hypothetical protein R3241_06530 [Rheinheimera sp.]|nr:hypothetical protein [Rheinheimera sp.]
MRTGQIMLLSLLLSGCQLPPVAVTEVTTPQPVSTVEPQTEVPAEQETVAEPLRINDAAATLQAWVQYRAALLTRINEEREALTAATEQDEVWQLKRTILQLHPDTPYVTRLRVQMQAAEQLEALPPQLVALLSWDLLFNQKLLEAESAVSALTRLNAQQHDNIDRLQKTNKELQKKIDALTQIEAQLNQPAGQGDNNGQR